MYKIVSLGILSQLTLKMHFVFLDLPQYPNVDPFNYETMKNGLLERLDTFNAAPFTIQRISELLSDPRKQYTRIDKFMRAVEKNILGQFDRWNFKCGKF